MSALQLHLFEPTPPLVERFGLEFFRAVPPKPGVYIMGGEAERILYIGQSHNLRRRLYFYKNARPDRAPRKIIRLIHSVRTITWEECPTPEAARLKENLLLRTHRPRFNVMNVYPPAYRFVALRHAANQLTLHLGTAPLPSAKTYGAFKGGCVPAFAALLRLLWAALHQPGSPHDFPSQLLATKTPHQFQFQLTKCPDLPAAVDNLLSGTSAHLIPWLTEALPIHPPVSTFQRNLITTDLELLAAFFEHGPQRNRHLLTRHQIPGSFIPQDQLDDCLV